MKNDMIVQLEIENDISGTCIKLSSCACKKNIYGTNQCVNSCGNDYYKMGKYCLSDCTGGNRKEVDSSIKKWECRYLYYITTDNEYICYNQNQYCEDIHKSYDYDTRLCKTEN